MFEGLPKLKSFFGMDLKIVCIVLGILELLLVVVSLGCEFTWFHESRYDSHFESKIWQTLLVIELYIQYVIYIARVVVTSFLLYGLFTRKIQFVRVYVVTMIFACIYYFFMSNVMLFTNFDVAIEYFITFFLDSITWLCVHSLHEIWRKADYEKASTTAP